ncbi:XRE family transcriptional regulator [Hymenobacter defluvii]|uniref:XRE family transcriptional regulator n=1 Tax=Hymenobacter defluvii TaxID=2054411 RepID=UPI0032636574
MRKEANNSPLGEQIKLLRKRSGFSQAVIANEVGVTKQAISAYESGVAKPSITILHKIAKALRVDVHTLLDPANGPAFLTEKQTVDVTSIELPLITHTDFSSFAQHCQTSSFPTAPILPVSGHDYQDAAILEIRGNSMAPRYPERARFIIRPVAESSWAHAHGVHAIILKSELLLLKRITSNQDSVLELSSDAAGEKIKVTLDEVSCLWKVGEGVYYPAED